MRSYFSAMNNNIPKMRRMLATLLALLSPALANAGEGDVFSLVTSASWQYLDNVFYLPDNNEPTVFGPNTPRGDHSNTISVGVTADKLIGRQRLTANVSENRVRYNDLDILDYDGYNIAAGWQWLVGSDLSGNLRYSNRRYLSGFGDFRESTLVKNLLDAETLRFDAAYKLDAVWTVFGSVGRDTTRNGALIRRSNDSDIDRLEAGFRYTTRGGTSFELLGRNTEGDYPRRLPGLNVTNSYSQKDIEARVRWQPVGHSRIAGAIGQSRREHDNVPQRDYDDVYGRVSWEWQPTGHTGVTFEAQRQISALDDNASSYFRTTTYTIAPVWQPTGKLRVDGRMQWIGRDGEGDTFFTQLGFVGTPREEDLTTYSVGATWLIERNLSANAEVRRDDRESNNQFYQYRVRSLSMSLQYVF
jgi:exopolysaccharide biosynthesis operon protein EpsL